jgi:prefoldin beta subunit
MTVDTKTEENIKRLQLYEQNMQTLSVQKQQFQSQLVEVETALRELATVNSAYKIIGNIMVASDTETLKTELTGKKEMLELRVRTLDKQETSVRDKSSKLQKEVLHTMNHEEDH